MKSQAIKYETIQICILGDRDMFGLEEYMDDNPIRQHTVICIQNSSVIYYFPKEALNEVFKRNGEAIL